METKVRHLVQISAQTGLPASIIHPIKPELFAGKHEAQLAKAVGVTQFGVNHVRLEPGAASALRHWHEREDEFVFVLSGEVTLVDENGEHTLSAGSFAGFPAGYANAHQLTNKSKAEAHVIVVGARHVGEEKIHYPDDNLGPVTIRRDASGERLPRDR